MLSLFRPAPHKARLPKEQIDPVSSPFTLANLYGDFLWLRVLLFSKEKLRFSNALPR